MNGAMTRASAHARRRGMSLIELLVAMSIMGIVSTMLIGGWFALGNSYSYTVRSDKARDVARQAISRMEREIRDAQNRDNSTEQTIVRARPFFIVLYTTFNDAQNEDPALRPRLVMYRLYSDGELWRFHDADADGALEGVSYNQPADHTWADLTLFSLSEQTSGEGAQLMCTSVVNGVVLTAGLPTPLFHYNSYAEDGEIEQSHMVFPATERAGIVAVQTDLLVDLNPKRSPVYTHLTTTAQLRNQR
jgi:prepilin-type N-terminal cleavage/methylation domain-containing protein